MSVEQIVRRTLRDHVLRPEPDEQGRAHTCACGAWLLDVTYGRHLIQVLDDAGLELGVRR